MAPQMNNVGFALDDEPIVLSRFRRQHARRGYRAEATLGRSIMVVGVMLAATLAAALTTQDLTGRSVPTADLTAPAASSVSGVYDVSKGVRRL